MTDPQAVVDLAEDRQILDFDWYRLAFSQVQDAMETIGSSDSLTRVGRLRAGLAGCKIAWWVLREEARIGGPGGVDPVMLDDIGRIRMRIEEMLKGALL